MAEIDPKVLKEAADAAKLAAKQIQAVTESLSEQLSVVLAIKDAYAQFSTSGVAENVNSMSKALSDALPVIEQISRKTRLANKHFESWSDNIAAADTTVTTLTGRMKDLTNAISGLGDTAAGGSLFSEKGIKELNDSHKQMDTTLSSMHDTIKEMKDNVANFSGGVADATKATSEMPTKAFDDMSNAILGSNKALKETQVTTERTRQSTSTLQSALMGAALSGGTFSGALAGVVSQTSLGQTVFKKFATFIKSPWVIAAGAGAGAINGLMSGLSGIVGMSGAVGGFFTNMIGWAFQLGTAILAIPVRFLGGLVEMAASMTGGSAEYLRQIEEVRDKFGNFLVGQSQAIKQMQQAFAKTTETGLNSWRIYGNLAERLKMITELVEGMGATWGVFQAEFAQDGFLQAKRVDEFRMGLGLTHEQLRSTLMLSKSLGKSAGSSLTDLTKHVKGYAKTLNVSHKVLTRDIADALKDAGKFGGATVSAIARSSAYARALGHELKEIAGVLDAFETFDTAAEGAAKLAQSFGATVDAFKLVSAQSPDEMIQHLRDSMFAAGQTTENMTRQQIKLLASQSGLSEEVARSVFSMKNQGKSVEELQKQQEQQEDSQVTQAKALRSLADDIKRLVKEMQPLKKSFVSMFIDGMVKGFTHSKEFLKLMYHIRKGLMLTWIEGRKLGVVLLSQVPSLNLMVKGLTAFFDPQKYQKLAKKMRHILLDFFKGNGGVSDMLHRAQEAFTSFFNTQNPAAKQMITGAKMILKRVSGAIAEGITWVSEQLVIGMRYIADLISGKNTGDLKLAGGLGGQALGFLYDILKPVINAIVKAAPLLVNAFVDLLTIAGKMIIKQISKDPIRGYLVTVAKTIGVILAGFIGTKMVIGGVTAALSMMISRSIAGVMSGPGKKSITDAAAKAGQEATKATGGMNAGSAATGAQTSTFLEGWARAAKIAGGMSRKEIGKLVLVLGAIGLGLGVAVTALAGGLWVSLKMLQNVMKKPQDTYNMLSLLGTVLIGTAIASQAAKGVNPKDVILMSAAMAATGVALGVGGVALAYGIVLISGVIKGLTYEELIKTGIIIGGLTLITTGVAAAAALIGKIADPKSIGAGALVIGAAGLFLGSMVFMIGTIVYSMKHAGVTTQGISEVANAMKSIAVAMLVMVPVIVAAAALGAVLAGPQAAVLGAAIGIGLTAITASVAALVGVAMGIIIALNKMNFQAGIDRKIKIFTSVLDSIKSMVVIISKILHDLSPGLSDLVAVIKGQSINERIKSTTEFIEKLIPQLKDLIKYVLVVVNDIGNSPVFLKGATAFASIFGALGSLISAMVPSPELLKGNAVKIGVFSAQLTMVTGSATDFAKVIGTQIKSFMVEIKDLITVVSDLGLSDSMMEFGIPAISGLLKSVTGLMKAIIPDSNTISQFVEIQEDSSTLGGLTSSSSKSKKVNTGGLKTFLEQIKTSFNDVIGLMTNKSFTDFLDKAASIGDTDQKFKSLDAVGKIMSTIGLVINSISSTVKNAPNVKVGDMKKASRIIINMPQPKDINTVLEKLSSDEGGLSKMFKLIINLTKIVSGESKIMKDFKVIEAVFASVGKIVEFIKMISSVKGSKDKSAMADYFALVEPIVSMNMFLQNFTDQSGKGSASFKTMSDSLNNLVKISKGISSSDVSLSFATITEISKTISNGMKELKDGIIKADIEPALAAVNEMVNGINHMNDALSEISLGKKQVTVGLRNVASSMGLGGKANYTINNKAVVIHLNMQVEMKAADVERTILFRKKSIIRDQLKWIRSSELENDKGPYGPAQADLDGDGAKYTRQTAN